MVFVRHCPCDRLQIQNQKSFMKALSAKPCFFVQPKKTCKVLIAIGGYFYNYFFHQDGVLILYSWNYLDFGTAHSQ